MVLISLYWTQHSSHGYFQTSLFLKWPNWPNVYGLDRNRYEADIVKLLVTLGELYGLMHGIKQE